MMPMPPRRAGIYRIVNTITGYVYIGSSINLEQRLKQHRTDIASGRHQNSGIRADIATYGADVFSLEVVEVTAPDDTVLHEAEKRAVQACALSYNGAVRARRQRTYKPIHPEPVKRFPCPVTTVSGRPCRGAASWPFGACGTHWRTLRAVLAVLETAPR